MERNEILKKTLLHYINLEYYANGLDEEFQTLLNELMGRCRKAILEQTTLNTKTSYNAIMGVIKEEVEEYRKELEERLDEVAESVMNQELEFLDETYNKPEKESSSLLKTAALALGGVSLAKILFAPIDGRDTTKQFAERTAKNILRSYDTSLRSGYLFGQNTEDVSAQIDGKMKQIARGIQSGIRTAVPSYAKTTDRIVFLNNDVEVVWVATLDGKTCINCAALSGVHFKSISEAPGILHNLCRCICIPTNSVSEPIPEFEEFIESLSEEEQEHVLGASRFELMNQYGVKPERFLNSGRVVPWKELKTDPFIVKIRNKNLNISETKLTGYALNPNHPLGKEKARVFKSALGYTVDNWKDLEENIRSHLNQSNMKLVGSDKYGKRLQCDTEITGPNGNTAVVRTGWIETPDGQITLTTIFVR